MSEPIECDMMIKLILNVALSRNDEIAVWGCGTLVECRSRGVNDRSFFIPGLTLWKTEKHIII